MNTEQAKQLIATALTELEVKQKAERDALVNGLIEHVTAEPEKVKAKHPRYRYLYVMDREDGTLCIRMQHKYGGGYLRYGIGTTKEAYKDAEYLDKKMADFAYALAGEQVKR